MRTKVKEKKLGAYIKELDDLVSLFVRISAADDTGTISCVCCGSRVYWKDSDCAHFKDRDNMATRFYLPNLGAADRECNRFDHYNHIRRWEQKLSWGQQVELNAMSHVLTKYTRPELEEMIEDYKVKVAALRKQKGI